MGTPTTADLEAKANELDLDISAATTNEERGELIVAHVKEHGDKPAEGEGSDADSDSDAVSRDADATDATDATGDGDSGADDAGSTDDDSVRDDDTEDDADADDDDDAPAKRRPRMTIDQAIDADLKPQTAEFTEAMGCVDACKFIETDSERSSSSVGTFIIEKCARDGRGCGRRRLGRPVGEPPTKAEESTTD